MQTAFVNASIYTGNQKITGKALLIENDTIKEIINEELISEKFILAFAIWIEKIITLKLITK